MNLLLPKTKDNDDKKIAVLVTALMFFYIVLLWVNQMFNIFIAYGVWYDSALCYGILAVLLLRALPAIFRRLNTKIIAVFLAMVAVFILSFFIASVNNLNITEYIPLLVKALLYYFVGVSIRNYDILEKYLIKSARVVIILAAIYVYFSINKGSKWQHDMTAAYSILAVSMCLVYDAFKRPGPVTFLWAVVAFITEFMAGTRGPILCLLIFVVITLFSIGFRGKRLFFGISLIIIFGILLLSGLLSQWMLDLSQWLSKVGINNVALERILTGSFIVDVSRNSLFAEALSFANQRPLLGYGVFSDRVLLGTYTHNIVSELLLDFGFVFGIVLLLLLLITSLHLLLKTRANGFKHIFIWMVVIGGVIKLMISNSYLEEPYFFMLIGLISAEYIVHREVAVNK